MRKIGSFPDQRAQKFADFLTGEGKHANVMPAQDGSFDLWVVDEDHLEEAKLLLEEFRQNPNDSKFTAGAKKAKAVRKEEAQRRERARQRITVGEQNFTRRTPVTFICLGICVLFSLLSNFDIQRLDPVIQVCSFNFISVDVAQQSGYVEDPAVLDAASQGTSGTLTLRAASLSQGEIWRVISPAFLHADLRHLIFNMLVLVSFGRRIEHLEGKWFMLGLVLVGAAIPNLLQGLIPAEWDGSLLYRLTMPNGVDYLYTPFAGFSGVDYALVSFIWVRGMTRFVPEYRLSGLIVFLLLGGFLLGVSGADKALLGVNMANWAHGGGILVGWVAASLPLGRTSKS